jgi:predicted ArsR family transcriptional regulator
MRDAGDIPSEMSRLTVDEAAHALGISTGAVRNRLSRGTLDSVKEDGTVYVLLPSDMSRDADDTPGDIPHEHGALISAKDETIRVLREQLESERAASAELRRIVAGLVQRVPELEPASEPRESPVTVTEGPEGEEPPG